MPELSNEEKARRVARFRKIVRYRLWFGWVFAFVGASLFFVGLQKGQNSLVIINGLCFFGYGLFMVRQAKQAIRKLS